MSGLAQFLTILIAVGAVVLIVALVRSRRLKERYALIWLLVAFGMLLLALARPLLDSLSRALGIQSGTTTLFLIATLVILGILLQLSMSLTALEEKVRDIAEAVALDDSALGESPEPVEESNDG
jgi:hypothetical protein